MGKILEAFANGELSTPRLYYGPDSEYGLLARRVCGLEKALRATLTEAETALLEELFQAQYALEDQDISEQFQRGYRLGMLMLLEVLEGRDELAGTPA